jgi:hypothetical protein
MLITWSLSSFYTVRNIIAVFTTAQNEPCQDPGLFSLHTHNAFKIHFNIIIPFLSIQIAFFPSGSSCQILYAFLISQCELHVQPISILI